MSYKDKIEELVGEPIKVTRIRIESYMSKTYEEGMWTIHTAAERPKLVALFKLVCLPGCCGVVVSTGAFVDTSFRGRGLGTLLNQMRQQMTYDLGYTVLLCTDVESNEPQQRILQSQGWMPREAFVNRRTGNRVLMHTIHLSDTGTELGFSLNYRGT